MVSLLLYIQGNDAAYLVQKRWADIQAPEDKLKQWTDYLLTVSVCDNRNPAHQSPKLDQQIPGVYFRTDGTNQAAH